MPTATRRRGVAGGGRPASARRPGPATVSSVPWTSITGQRRRRAPPAGRRWNCTAMSRACPPAPWALAVAASDRRQLVDEPGDRLHRRPGPGPVQVEHAARGRGRGSTGGGGSSIDVTSSITSVSGTPSRQRLEDADAAPPTPAPPRGRRCLERRDGAEGQTFSTRSGGRPPTPKAHGPPADHAATRHRSMPRSTSSHGDVVGPHLAGRRAPAAGRSTRSRGGRRRSGARRAGAAMRVVRGGGPGGSRAPRAGRAPACRRVADVVAGERRPSGSATTVVGSRRHGSTAAEHRTCRGARRQTRLRGRARAAAGGAHAPHRHRRWRGAARASHLGGHAGRGARRRRRPPAQRLRRRSVTDPGRRSPRPAATGGPSPCAGRPPARSPPSPTSVCRPSSAAEVAAVLAVCQRRPHPRHRRRRAQRRARRQRAGARRRRARPHRAHRHRRRRHHLDGPRRRRRHLRHAARGRPPGPTTASPSATGPSPSTCPPSAAGWPAAAPASSPGATGRSRTSSSASTSPSPTAARSPPAAPPARPSAPTSTSSSSAARARSASSPAPASACTTRPPPRRAARGASRTFDRHALDAQRRVVQRGGHPAVLRLYDATEAARSYHTPEGLHLLLAYDEGDAAAWSTAPSRIVDEVCADAGADDRSTPASSTTGWPSATTSPPSRR